MNLLLVFIEQQNTN